MTKKFKVSQSKVKTYRRCHRAYHNKYVLKLRKKRKARALQFGTMIHEALETHFNGDDFRTYFKGLEKDVKKMKLFAQERDEYGDILNDTRDLVTDYVDYWGKSLRPIRKAGRGAEHSFEIEFIKDIVFEGKIDMLGREKRLRLLVEHKTYTRRPSDDDRWRNLQSVVYFRANDMMGWKPLDGCLWDYVRSKPPAIPGLLKDGSFSTRRIDTLPSTIRRAIKADRKASKATSKDAKKHLIEMAERNRDQCFQRVTMPVKRPVVDLVFSDFEKTVKEMVDNHGKVSDMNIERQCSWCDYEALCRAELQGLDTEYVKQREYTDGTKKKSDRKEAAHKFSFKEVKKHRSSRSKG